MTQNTDQLDIVDKIKRMFKQPLNLVLYRSKGEVVEYTVQEFFDKPRHELFRLIPECCLFSALAYVGDAREVERKNSDGETELKTIELPPEWQELTDLADIVALYRERKTRKTYDGLVYRIFFNATDNIMVVAFRGSTKAPGDWLTNARWLTRFNPFHDDHYDVVNDQIDELLISASQVAGSSEPRIITTGHSLGGGLASQAAYATSRISEVIVINSSPVTGFYGVVPAERKKNKQDMVIARLFEHGEILAIPRLALRAIYRLSHQHPEIVEARFNFGVRKSFVGVLHLYQYITEHSLTRFVDTIWLQVRGKSIFEEAEHPGGNSDDSGKSDGDNGSGDGNGGDSDIEPSKLKQHNDTIPA